MRRARATLSGLALLALGATGCPDEGAEPDERAGEDAAVAVSPTFVDDALGVRFSWPATWSRVGAVDAAAEPDADGVVVLAKIVRVSKARVPPRVELTMEPTTLDDPRLAARRVKNVLEAKLEESGAEVRRVSVSERRVGADLFGRIDLRYAVPVPPKASVGVHHRSVVAVRADPEGSLAILTLTATYLARDAESVRQEVEGILQSLTLAPPAGG